MMPAQERAARLEMRVQRAREVVEFWSNPVRVETEVGLLNPRLAQEELEKAQEELAAAETLLLLALEREALFSKVESASKIMTNATAETPAQGPRKRIKSVDKS